ncbi:hypothetical protein [Campylobacter sp. MIT 97-5078]|uniref:hypothetical protein n=1 Tax=Campylobacter sp. MIT 97-5078 TaxID=1548153 RepID=UPI000512E236|nr:hypothetical protein [Campylobacter sp. MIT 97-5078]KGI55115.1 hypothetical protein LR59_13255 [Campylobacter sp. MIT 97-5078]TQR22654.1 hypothetical protein DMB91_08690 [Campylobacter sp. MIT 97-5078]
MFELACLLVAIILVFGAILSFFNIIKIKKLENELFLFKLKFTNLNEKLQLLEKTIHTLNIQNDEKPSLQKEQNLALKSVKNPHLNLDKKAFSFKTQKQILLISKNPHLRYSISNLKISLRKNF